MRAAVTSPPALRMRQPTAHFSLSSPTMPLSFPRAAIVFAAIDLPRERRFLDSLRLRAARRWPSRDSWPRPASASAAFPVLARQSFNGSGQWRNGRVKPEVLGRCERALNCGERRLTLKVGLGLGDEPFGSLHQVLCDLPACEGEAMTLSQTSILGVSCSSLAGWRSSP